TVATTFDALPVAVIFVTSSPEPSTSTNGFITSVPMPRSYVPGSIFSRNGFAPDAVVMPASAASSAVPFCVPVPTGLTTTVRAERGCALRFVRPAPSPTNTLAAFERVSALPYVPPSRPPGTVPEARFVAFRPVSAAPLPVNVPLTTLPALVRLSACAYVPERRASGTVPEVRLLAFRLVRLAGSVRLLNRAYGEGVSSCRGASVVYAPPPGDRTSISQKRAWPARAAVPKSSGATNNPWTTVTALTLSGPPTTV